MFFNIAIKKKRNSITGRSMLEMLGVLAVIGILSIASLSGMTYLKEKNIANQITKEAITQAAEIKARAKQFVDGSGEIQYARGGESLYIFSRKYGSAATGKTTLILSAKMRDENGNFNHISKSLCQKMISKEKVGIFNCILADESATTCPISEDADVSCKEDNVIVFITDATTTIVGDSNIDACANVRCPDDRVCAAGVCVCKPPKHEGPNGTCISCGEPKGICEPTNEQLAMVDVNGCPIYKRKNCPENACNLLTGDCCDLGETYDATAQLCCLPAKRLTACDSEVSSSLGECSYYQGCIDSTCYTEYNNDGECCTDINTSESCCYAVHIRENPIYYTTANVKNLLKFDNFTSDQKCTCKYNFAGVEKVCCKEGEIVSNGHCCPAGQEYQASIGACCPTGQFASTQGVCCKAGEIVSEGHCCPAGQEWVTGTGANMCMSKCDAEANPTLTGERDPVTHACKCKDGLGTTCSCPAGYILVGNACHRFHCDGEGAYCYIDNHLCGSHCTNTNDLTKITCVAGICRQDLCACTETFCPSPYTTGELVDAGGQHGYALGGGWSWGCKINSSYGDCYYRQNPGTYFCFEEHEGIQEYDGYNHQVACIHGSTSSTSVYQLGVCDEAKCPAGGVLSYNDIFAECNYPSSGVSCLPVSSQLGENANPVYYICRNAAGVCSSNCTNPPSCNGQCTTLTCPAPFVWNAEKNACYEKDTDVSCKVYLGNNVDASYICSKNEKQCGTNCYINQNSTNQSIRNYYKKCTFGGYCWDPGCPAGFTFAHSGTWIDFWGCKKDTGTDSIFCHFASSEPRHTCYKNGALCGKDCDLGANCNLPVMEDCAIKDQITGKKKCAYHAPITETCTCDTNRTAAVGSYCCPAGHRYLNGACTLSSCSADQYITSNGICVEKCPTGQVALGDTCVTECPENQVISNICKNNICQDTCVTACPTGQVVSAGRCVDACPSGQVISEGRCVDACPEGQTANAENVCQ